MGAPRKLDGQRFFSDDQKRVLYLLANGCCRMCGMPLGNDWHADHVEPWAFGGRTVIDNGQALCAPCNLWKSATDGSKPRPPIHSMRMSKEPVRFAKNNIARILARLVATDSGCLQWAGKTHHGYGVCMLAKRWVRVHRVVWEYFNGPIPAGNVLHHTCRNRACANPWHLEPCTIHENLLKDHPDYYGKGQRQKTHCPYGHPYDESNTRRDKRGFRSCAACRNGRKRDRRVREKANREVMHGTATAYGR